MDHKFGRQVATCGNNCFTGFATALPGDDHSAFLQDLLTACAMYGTIHTATTHQAGISCIYYGINL
jgi:hypothetical protein